MRQHLRNLAAIGVAAAVLLTGCTGENEQATSPLTPEPPAPVTVPREPEQRTEPEIPTHGHEELTPDPAPQPAEEIISIVDFRFSPDALTVRARSSVTWIQEDNSLHTVDFADGTTSGDMRQGDTYTRVFDDPGEYEYDCFYHPRMVGVIIVE